MTKATGKREAQRRREEMFSAEIKLTSVLRHLRESASWAKLLQDPFEYPAIAESYVRVKLRLQDLQDEQKALGAKG